MKTFSIVSAVLLALYLAVPTLHAQRDRNDRGITIKSKTIDAGKIAKEREARREKFMKDAAARHTWGNKPAQSEQKMRKEGQGEKGFDADLPVIPEGPKVDYRGIYKDHIRDHYTLVNGQPAPLPYELRGKVMKIIDEKTLLVSELNLMGGNGKSMQDKVVAVKTDMAAAYAEGEPFSDLMGRRFKRAKDLPVRTASGNRNVPCFEASASISYEDFMAHLQKGYRFSKR